MTSTLLRVAPVPALGGRRAGRLLERNVYVYRRYWLLFVSGALEPVFYLLSIGIGIGGLVGTVTADGRVVDYAAYVAPALLASAAMNGAIYDSTFNVFYKLKYAKTYDALLATPVGVGDVALGEIAWALLRGLVYSTSFLAVMLAMGLADGPGALLALPAASLVGFAFAAVGMAATTFMRGWQDFEFVQLAVLPLFLFSATFYPLSTYPEALSWVVQATPLYHGVALVRDLTLGVASYADLGHAAYLLALGLAGLAVVGARLERLLLH